jgi:hypothetical protein
MCTAKSIKCARQRIQDGKANKRRTAKKIWSAKGRDVAVGHPLPCGQRKCTAKPPLPCDFFFAVRHTSFYLFFFLFYFI